jgi:hypothetical protein
MRNLIALALFVLVGVTSTYSQLPVVWERRMTNNPGHSYSNYLFHVYPGGGYVAILSAYTAGLSSPCSVHPISWLGRFDNDGNVLWSKCLPITEFGSIYAFEVTDDGSFILIRSAAGGASGTANTTYATKLNASGEIIWNTEIGFRVQVVSTGKLKDGGICYTGNKYGSPGGSVDGIVYGAVNATGQVLWQKQLMYRFGSAIQIQQLSDQQLYLSITQPNFTGCTIGGGVIFRLSQDGDTIRRHCLDLPARPLFKVLDDGGVLVTGLTDNLSRVQLVTRLNPNFQKMWEQAVPPGFLQILKDPAGGYLLVGSKEGTMGRTEARLLKLNIDNGAVDWTRLLTYTDNSSFHRAIYLDDGNLLFGGQRFQFNEPNARSVFHSWFVKVRNYSRIEGEAFFDDNRNGVKDALERPFHSGVIDVTGPDSSVSTGLLNGRYSVDVTPGQYATSLRIPNSNFEATPVSKQTTFADYQLSDTINFAVTSKTSVKDLSVTIFPADFARPGFNHSVRIVYANLGTEPLSNIRIRLIKDRHTEYVSSTIAPLSQVSDTITWPISFVHPTDTGSIAVKLKVAAPPVRNNGDTIRFTANVVPVDGESTILNNESNLAEVLRGSYDPNDKIENRNGVLEPSELGKDTYLTYTIRFQNTGTDTAFGVIVRDTLEQTHQLSTFEMIASSHPYELTITEDKLLKWHFHNILLPDSNVNEPASHGYITYRIKPDSTLAVGTSITNTASIYFDYNLPVKTAAAVTVIRPERPVVPVITAPGNSFCSNAGVQKFKVHNVPEDPYTYSGKLDNNTISIGADSTVSVDPSTLSVGEHRLVVSFSNGFETTNSEVAFSVVAAQTPGVSLGASATALNKDVTTSTLTATAGSAAGNGAQFTFAKDREFTSILRAEASANTYILSASDLTSGNNRLYVRMRSSEVCLTATTAIDSIDITLDTTTTQPPPPPPPPPPPTPSSKGFVDPEHPNTIINIFPNPVDDHITIRGLQPSKQYQVRIVNMNGQLVKSQSFSGIETATIGNLAVLKGNLILSLIDQRKKSVIGTTSLVR